MLFGEHAVVYGRKCIVTAVDAYVAAEASFSGKFTIDSHDMKFSGEIHFGQEYPKEIQFAAKAIENFYSEFGLSEPVHISTKNLFPAAKKYGLGTSSSITVAVMKSLARLHGIETEKELLFKLAYKTILDIQGKGSGFDVAAAVYGGTLLYNIGNPKPISNDSMSLVVGYSGTPADTVSIVEMVAERMKESPKRHEKLLDEIERVVLKAEPAIAANDMEKIGILMTENHELLKELGVSSGKLDRMCISAIEAGAFGAKLSGAGMGDCMIAVTDESKREYVEKAIKSEGGEILNVKINAEAAE